MTPQAIVDPAPIAGFPIDAACARITGTLSQRYKEACLIPQESPTLLEHSYRASLQLVRSEEPGRRTDTRDRHQRNGMPWPLPGIHKLSLQVSHHLGHLRGIF